MPYIKREQREKFQKSINELISLINDKGELNYVVCEIVAGLILRSDVNYKTISEWIDAVDGAEHELKRRILDTYENIKIVENVDLQNFSKVINPMVFGKEKKE